jgi:hypothetical protein
MRPTPIPASAGSPENPEKVNIISMSRKNRRMYTQETKWSPSMKNGVKPKMVVSDWFRESYEVMLSLPGNMGKRNVMLSVKSGLVMFN